MAASHIPIGAMAIAATLVVASDASAFADVRTAQIRIERTEEFRTGPIGGGRTLPDIRRHAVPAYMRTKGCMFYSNPNGQGSAMRQVVTDLVPGSEGAPIYHTLTTRLGDTWNDTISSVRCDFDQEAYCYATLYREADFVGPSTTIRGDVNRVVNLMAGTGWNDVVTSFQVACSQRRG